MAIKKEPPKVTIAIKKASEVIILLRITTSKTIGNSLKSYFKLTKKTCIFKK